MTFVGIDGTVPPDAAAVRGCRKTLLFEGPGQAPFIECPEAARGLVPADVVAAKSMYSGQPCPAPQRIC